MKKDKKPDQVNGFNFKTVNLDEQDITILISNEMNGLLGNITIEQSKIPFSGILIASSSEDQVGIGNLLAYRFEDILELGRDDEGELYIVSKTTEEIQTDLIFDFKVIFS